MFLRNNVVALLAVCLALATPPASSQSLVESILNLLREGGMQENNEPQDRNEVMAEYDFVVVGAGTAGCAVANRLTEVPQWQTLLLEAGHNENFIMDFPILANYLQFTQSNWKYKTQRTNKFCLGMENQQCNWPRGKVMGGSSVLNYMILTRGNRRDYDNWEALGNTGWSYEDVLPYFKKLENMEIEELRGDTKYHSTSGYLSVTYPPYRTPIAESWVKGGQELGLPYVDYNGATQTGISFIQASMKNGTRHSSSRAYLHPIRDRSNLHVQKGAMVTRILIDPKTRRAYGVEYRRQGKRYSIRARKEVILTAGAINTPQLLMLSGVGPKQHLAELGIPLLQDARVGYNLMDHIATGGLTFLIDQQVSLASDRLLTTENLIDYLSYHRGPMSVPGGCEALAFYDMKNPNATDGYPDMELLFIGGSITSDQVLKKDFGLTDELYDRTFKPIEGTDSFMVFPMLMRPRSKGRIMLRDNNPMSKPLIYPNYFAYKDDMRTMVQGVRKAIEIAGTPAMRKMGTRLHTIPIPSCAGYAFNSDAYWGCHARHLTFTIYHYSGTCKMGPKADPTAVVDPRLRVHGVKNLRVADASIIPVIPAAHTNQPVFMIAEKAADMIKEDWGALTSTSRPA